MASLRSSTSVLPRAMSSRTTTILPRSQAAFSTTTCLKNNRIPPESPSFINIPTPPQTEASEKKNPHVKGHLPVPRQIFRQRDGTRKLSRDFLEKTAPRPSSPASLGPPISEGQEWKRRMAEVRRQNLGAGIKGLWARKRQRDVNTQRRRTQQIKELEEARSAPIREDERLTQPSISEEVLDLRVRPDPLRYERALASRERTTQLNEQQRQERLDNLQSLYMHARSFITTEADLEARVAKVFSEDFFPSHGGTWGQSATNAWGVWGNPSTVSQMVKETIRDTNKRDKSLDPWADADEARTLKRQLRLAEELTGGKMDER